METYRTEKQATVQIALQDEDAEIDPVQGERGGGVQVSPARTPVPSSWTSSTKPGGTRSNNPDHITEIIKDMPDRVNEGRGVPEREDALGQAERKD